MINGVERGIASWQHSMMLIGFRVSARVTARTRGGG